MKTCNEAITTTFATSFFVIQVDVNNIYPINYFGYLPGIIPYTCQVLRGTPIFDQSIFDVWYSSAVSLQYLENTSVSIHLSITIYMLLDYMLYHIICVSYECIDC